MGHDTYQEANDLENALSECQAVIQLDSNCAEAHNLHGLVLEGLGRKEEALAAYRAASHLDSTFQEAQENLLELEKEIREGKIPKGESIHSQEELSSGEEVGKKFGVRAGAYIIDVIALYLLNLATGFVGGILLGILLLLNKRPIRFDQGTLGWVNLVAGLVLSVLYFAVFEWLYGATIGKIILRMRVVQENGTQCGFGAAFVRGLLRYIDSLFFAIPAYMSMKHPLYQRIGDKAAKTLVVSSKNLIIRKPRSWWWFVFAASLYFTLAMFIQILAAIVALR